MTRLHRLSWALLLVAAGCGDDVTGQTAGSTGEDSSSSSTGGPPIDITTTTIDPTSSSSSGTETTVDPDTSGSSTTDADTDTTSSSTGAESSSSTGDESSSSSTTTGLDCGNDMVDEGEDCDGVDLADATCVSEGFVSGDLACADDCTFDVSACLSCGNDVIDDGEDCDGADLGDATCVSIGMGFTGGALGCIDDCTFDTSACTSLAVPGMGEVVISEIMPNPTAVADADGEWFELHNPSAVDTYELGGCEISGQDGEAVITIATDLSIAPGEDLVFSPMSKVDPGFTTDYGYTENFSVANGGDIITLSCGGMMVDTVDYDTFPPAAGVSLNLDIDTLDATSNDAAENWCPGTTIYNDPDTGTPGETNVDCIPPAVYDIDFCRLQFPEVINEDTGTDVTVYGRLYIEGLTDQTAGNDVAPEVSGQVGYGPDGTDPAVDAGWTWIGAVPNPGWDGSEVNNDEYQAVLPVPAPGEYDYAYRFSGDTEATYTYCDAQAGSSDGYQVASAGQMTSNAIAGDFDLYFSEYVEGSSNNKALELYNAGTEAVDLTACQIVQYNNGSPDPTYTLPGAGTIAPDDVLVICRSTAGAELLGVCDVATNNNVLGFNGDDALELSCNGTVLDVIGMIGEDPGSEWPTELINPTPTAGTQDETIRRNCDSTPDTDGSDAYDPSTDWTSFPQDTFDDLGQYVCD